MSQPSELSPTDPAAKGIVDAMVALEASDVNEQPAALERLSVGYAVFPQQERCKRIQGKMREQQKRHVEENPNKS